MSNISVTTTQSVIDVTQTSGITVTTPEGQTINVEVPNSSVNVTSTPNEITVTEVGITNTDQLIEGTTNLFFTNARARTAISLTTDDSQILGYNSSTGVFTWDTPTTTKILEGTNLYYTDARADARVALGIAGINFPVDSVNGQTQTVVLDTDDINEGSTNLYYTSARANSDFDTRLATKSTTNLTEGTNLYYTTARSNSDFDTRLATKTTTNLAEGTNLYYTTDRFDTRFATKTTDNLNEGTTNKYFTNALARASISATDTGGDGSLSYDNTTGVITYTGPSASEVRAHFSGGTGVTITSGTIAIGQSVSTTDSVTFGSVNIDSRAVIDTATLTTSATTADQVLDSFSASTYRTAKYLISISSGTDYHSIEMLVNHNGIVANQTTYADLPTNTSLATFSVDINGGNVRLLTTPVNAVSVYTVTRTTIVV